MNRSLRPGRSRTSPGEIFGFLTRNWKLKLLSLALAILLYHTLKTEIGDQPDNERQILQPAVDR